MPTYEYICDKCGHRFDLFQSIASAPLTVCPEDVCGRKRWGKGSVKRAISGGAGLIFKGSGFYITDYRSEGYKQAAKKDAAPVASGNGGPANSSESKSRPSKADSKAVAPAKTKT